MAEALFLLLPYFIFSVLKKLKLFCNILKIGYNFLDDIMEVRFEKAIPYIY